MALRKNKDVTLSAYSVVGDDKKEALRMTASLSTSTTNDAVNQSVLDTGLYMAHKSEVRKDIAEFQQYVYEQEDQLAAELNTDLSKE